MNQFEGASSEELLEFARKNLPIYRRLLSRLRSFVFSLFGRRHVATAAGHEKIDINRIGDSIKPTGSKINLTNFKVPSFTKMKQHISVLQASDRIDELEAWVAAAKKDPSNAVKQASKAMIAILGSLQTEFNTAQDALEEFANKHVPVEVADIFEAAKDATTKIMSSYTQGKVVIGDILQIGSEDDRIDFCYYMDVTEYVERPLWIIVTCSILAAGNEYIMSRHVAVQDRFQAPMMYDFGLPTLDIDKTIKHELAAEGVIAVMDRVKLKVDTTRLETSLKRLPFFKSLNVDERELQIYIKNNKQNQNEYKEIFAVLTTDTDIRRQLGRTKRLFGEFENGHWVFSISSRS